MHYRSYTDVGNFDKAVPYILWMVFEVIGKGTLCLAVDSSLIVVNNSHQKKGMQDIEWLPDSDKVHIFYAIDGFIKVAKFKIF